MRLLRVTSSYYPATSFGGSVTADYCLDSELVKHNINIDVATTNAGLEKELKIGEWIEEFGVKTKYFRYIGYKHFNISLPFILFLIKNTRKYSVIHVSGVWNFPVLVAPLVAKIFRRPYIITLHGALLKKALSSKKVIVKKILYHLFVRPNLLFADKIHVTSINEREDLIRLSGVSEDKIEYIPFGIPAYSYSFNANDKVTFRRSYGVSGGDDVIVFLGRIHPIKGLDMLIRSFIRLSELESKLKLLVIGPDDVGYKSELLNNIDSFTRDKIIFTGHLVGLDKYLGLFSSDIFILPSYMENFGMTVIEAMQMELPVIVTDQVGISTELVPDYHAVVTKCNENDIFKGVRKLLVDDKLKMLLAMNGNKLYKSRFTSNAVANKMIKVYEGIIRE